MRVQTTSLRTKLTVLTLVPLISLSGLWVYSIPRVSDEVSQLRSVSEFYEHVAPSVRSFTASLQVERAQSMSYLNAGRSASLASLQRSQEEADRSTAELRNRTVQTGAAQRGALEDLLSATGRLGGIRRETLSHSLSPAGAMREYNGVIGASMRFLGSMTHPDARQSRRTTALLELTQAQELLAQECAVLAAVGGRPDADVALLRLLDVSVATRRSLLDTHVPRLTEDDRTGYEKLRRAAFWTALERDEGTFLQDGSFLKRGGAAASRVDAKAWRTAAGEASRGLDLLNQRRVSAVGALAGDNADDLVRRGFTIGGLGLLTVLMTIALSTLLGRHLARELLRLRDSAWRLAHEQLPGLLQRLGKGENVDVETALPLRTGDNEIGQVARAFNLVRQAAVHAAVSQAEIRRAATAVFASLARRSQALIQRQHAALDAMERRTDDPDALAELFRLDHLTTLMRRHAEGLIVLAGGPSPRTWNRPVPVVDVVRAGVGEVEDYTRVVVHRFPELTLIDPAVADVAHLIAELLENATQNSPPDTQVTVDAERVANGCVVTIEDRGTGMDQVALAKANALLREDLEFDRTDARHLGLFVVSRLSHRHGLKVSLRRSAYGGISAVVLIPDSLLPELPRQRATETSTWLPSAPPRSSRGAGAHRRTTGRSTP
ncbi:nitrate- and nitrite sensing domain-containing protein [Streptomyces sp. NPDC050658]|uniref:nitrate- and nitrite sensing domain-containing protein n=1 Tax=unclassified Streptomyces TaxID=2593676 RepID=UPI00342D17A9